MEYLHELCHQQKRSLIDTAVMPFTTIGKDRDDALRGIQLESLIEEAHNSATWTKPASGKFSTLEDLRGVIIAGAPDDIVRESRAYQTAGASHIVYDLRLRYADWYDQIDLLGNMCFPHCGEYRGIFMTLLDDLSGGKKDSFIALIFDNEVTVGEFVVDPALPWIRLVQNNGVFQVADGYPTTLTAAQAKFEMKNWDVVSLPAIAQLASECGRAMDVVVFGNNAGQGFPLASALPQDLTEIKGAVIYASNLPEQSAYERLGYRKFWRRKETAIRLLDLAKSAGRPLSLFFVNTIQHNEMNYHDP